MFVHSFWFLQWLYNMWEWTLLEIEISEKTIKIELGTVTNQLGMY